MISAPPGKTASSRLLSTGVSGLDDILHGGLAEAGLYAIEGDTGAGKTTLCLQFLLAGVQAGERVLFVTLSESTLELQAMAASHGWSLDGIEILELTASAESLSPDANYTMFHPAEVELTETTRAILEAAERIQAKRKRIWAFYDAQLGDWAAENGVRLPVVPPHCEQPFHICPAQLDILERIDALRNIWRASTTLRKIRLAARINLRFSPPGLVPLLPVG